MRTRAKRVQKIRKVPGMAAPTGSPNVPKGHESGGRNLNIGIKLHRITDVRKLNPPEHDGEEEDTEVFHA